MLRSLFPSIPPKTNLMLIYKIFITFQLPRSGAHSSKGDNQSVNESISQSKENILIFLKRCNKQMESCKHWRQTLKWGDNLWLPVCHFEVQQGVVVLYKMMVLKLLDINCCRCFVFFCLALFCWAVSLMAGSNNIRSAQSSTVIAAIFAL